MACRPTLRTMIVMPTLLTSPAGIAEQVKRLEVHHLANSDGDLCFALLSDWTDSETQTAPGDGDLLRAATDGVAELNRRYGRRPVAIVSSCFTAAGSGTPDRSGGSGGNASAGKLHEFNRLLRGADGHELRFDRRQSASGARGASATSSSSMPTRGCRGAPPNA